jgi:hypothetical protein
LDLLHRVATHKREQIHILTLFQSTIASYLKKKKQMAHLKNKELTVLYAGKGVCDAP